MRARLPNRLLSGHVLYPVLRAICGCPTPHQVVGLGKDRNLCPFCNARRMVETAARQARTGIWSAPGLQQRPWAWRDRQRG